MAAVASELYRTDCAFCLAYKCLESTTAPGNPQLSAPTSIRFLNLGKMGSITYPTVSIAVIGAGTIGHKHIGIVNNNQDTILTAIVDPTSGGKEVASNQGCKYFSTVEDLLASGSKPDAAIVCTPNETHVPISKKLAEAGVHLFIEKPLSANVAEGQQLLDACSSYAVQVCVGHHRRFHSSIKATKLALESGSIGDVLGVSGLWASLKTDSYFEGDGRWRAGSDGGVVLINLVHELDLLQYLLGTHRESVCRESALDPWQHRGRRRCCYPALRERRGGYFPGAG